MSSIAYGGIIAFLFRGVNLLVALALVVVTSNHLGGEGRGTFVLGVTAVGIVSALTGGLTAATAYQVSNQQRAPGVVLLNGGSLAAALGIVAIAAGFAGRELLSGEPGVVSISVGASAAAVILVSVIAGVLLGKAAMVRYNLALVLPPLLSLAAIVATIFVLDRETPEAALVAFAVGQWTALGLLLATGVGAMLHGIRFEAPLAATMLRFAMLAGLSSAVSYLNYRADVFVVEHFEGRHGVAIYSNAVYIAESVWQFSGSLALASYPRVGALEEADAALLTARVMRHTIVILGVVCAFLFAVAGLVVQVLFDPEFAPVADALRILLPGVLVYGLAASFSGFYTYQRGKPWAAAVVASTGLAIDIALALILVPRMGVNGAALASAIAYSAAIAGALVVFLRSSRLGLMAALRFTRADLDDYRELAGRLRAFALRGSTPGT